jgi:hypothetical protein
MSGAHVIPVSDLIEHEASEECACMPADEAVTRPDGSCGWISIHHALDGRELSE